MSTDRSGRGGYYAICCAGLAIAASLLWLAWPRIVADMYIVSFNAAVSRSLSSGGAIDAALLDRARDGYEAAADTDRSDASHVLALARLDLRAGDTGQAEGQLKKASSLAPNDAFVWSELASLAMLRREPAAKVAEYLKLSWLTGPYELSSMIARPKVALSYWDELPPELREKTGADIRRMWDDEDLRWYLRPLYLSLGYEERARFLDAGFPNQAARRAFVRQVLWKLKLKKELQRYDRRNPQNRPDAD